jgi:glycolate oxidase iron-sulfur subunit
VIAAGNIGCITQIAGGTGIPVVHTVELIDWATGGPAPEGLRGELSTAPALPADSGDLRKGSAAAVSARIVEVERSTGP